MASIEPSPAASVGGCGGSPKPLGIGIAPLGIVAIGIVPMGVVSIGVVPMGVISIGAVGMGVINAAVVGMGVLVMGVNVMGVWWGGYSGMGPHRLGGEPTVVPAQQRFAYPSRQEALDQARRLGCRGVHAMGNLWMPCDHH
ncbi:MAG: hypothetical protein FJ077_14960 [Cyanobacteria bacterium K_DeepCast_35m_m2_023]|nr:hypothetical protein [Cyanobacteria bacterium K_DeepCast_35m_m2_023]